MCLSVLPSVAHASPFAAPSFEVDGEVAEAKAEYRKGSDAYALGNYEEAVGHFERAFELSQEPALLFNLGQSYTRWYDISNDLEHLKKARRLYENYVLTIGATDLSEGQQADARADAQRRISEVDRRIAQHDDDGPRPSTTRTDGKPKKPVHKRAWFWVAIVGGLAVVGGVTAAVLLTNKRPGFDPELGTIGRAPLGGNGGSGGLTFRF